MADAIQYKKVRAIVESDPTRRVVVVSAAGKRFKEDHKITDLLYLCHAHVQYGVSFESVFGMIADRYRGIKEDLGLKIDIESHLEQIRNKLISGMSEEELASRGEYLSALLMADYLGFDFVDAAHWLKFRYDGTIDQEESYAALRREAEGRKVVIPGFYGVMPDGQIQTLTRGGSDITGALAAAALDADVYENWTDVSGILMADPRIVEDPQPIDRVTYSELRELSHAGAQVLHEGTIYPVREKKIPLNIRNTNEPDHPGTMIMESFDDSMDMEHRFITGIAGKKDHSIITLTKIGLSSAVGELRRILEVFEDHNIPVEYVPSGLDTVSLVVDSAKVSSCLYSMLGELQKKIKPNNIKVHDQIAIVAAVGRKMAFRAGISGRIFARLGENGISIRMISQGPDEMNIIVGIDNKDYANAIRVLYNSFVK